VNKELEAISDKIRAGVPVSFQEAIAAINYQGQINAEREANKWYRRFWRWLKQQGERRG
jgi:hypothetical protein